jgi:hypothetical protein
LWTAAIALGVVAVAKIVLYIPFQESASEACDAVVGLEPDGGWSDSSFPCEQFASLGWILPYWLLTASYVVFTLLFMAAARKVGKAGPGAPTFAMVITILATVFAVVPGVLDLDWLFATATANQADTLVAERIRDDVPGWFAVGELAALVLVFAASLFATILLQRTKPKGTIYGRA